MNAQDHGSPSSAFKSAIREAGLDRAGFYEPGGWFVYRVVDSEFIRASLTEVLNDWTLGHLADAFRRDLYYVARAEASTSKPPSNPLKL